MKHVLFCFLSLILFLSSCKKEESEKFANYYIKHKINGKTKEYKIDVLASTTKIDNEYYFILSGRRELNTNQTLIVDFADPLSIEEKAYKQNSNHEYHIAYGDDNNDFYTSQRVTNPDINVTITKITKTAISGTFRGKVREDISGQEAIISEGEFYAKLN